MPLIGVLAASVRVSWELDWSLCFFKCSFSALCSNPWGSKSSGFLAPFVGFYLDDASVTFHPERNGAALQSASVRPQMPPLPDLSSLIIECTEPNCNGPGWSGFYFLTQMQLTWFV